MHGEAHADTTNSAVAAVAGAASSISPYKFKYVSPSLTAALRSGERLYSSRQRIYLSSNAYCSSLSALIIPFAGWTIATATSSSSYSSSSMSSLNEVDGVAECNVDPVVVE